MTDQVSREMEVERDQGVLVKRVEKNTPAADAGIERNYYYLIGGRRICPVPGPGTYGDSTIDPDPRDKVDQIDPCVTP